MLNLNLGAVRWDTPFAGGPNEMTPSNCDSPYNCRCALLIRTVAEPATFVWDGDERIYL